MNENNTPSYLLGTFVAMSQKMQEVDSATPARGQDWGEQVLPLFQANLDSTLQISEKALGSLPETAVLPCGRIIEKKDIVETFQKIDLGKLRGGCIQETEYLAGYHRWQDGTEDRSPSEQLGRFLALVHFLEQVYLGDSHASFQHPGEDLYLMLEINFNSTLEIGKKVIQTLQTSQPATACALGLQDLKEAYEAVDFTAFAQEPLEKQDFLLGFQRQLDSAHSV